MIERKEKATGAYPSSTVFWAIGLLLVAMTGFMMVAKHYGILNPKATWDLEFQNLKNIVLEFDRSAPKHPNRDLAPANLRTHLEFYAGTQLSLSGAKEWEALDYERIELNGKPVIMIKLTNHTDSTNPRQLTFGIFPIAVRQLQKTYKFSLGSFLWHTYRYNLQNTSFVVDNEQQPTASDQVHLIAANYMNDYFVFAVGRGPAQELATDVSRAISFYHEDFIKVL